MKKSILVVDDAKTIRLLLRLSLEGVGYQVIEAADGLEALEHLNRHSIDLIMSDLNLPHMDGLGFAREVKKRPNHEHTPFIMITTETGLRRKEEARDMGVDAWMLKPFKSELMLAAVDRLLRSAQVAAQTAA